MIQIPLSRIESSEAFAAALEAHRAALAAHRIGEPGVPAPLAHELLHELVLRVPESGPVESRGPDRFEIAPYEIIDDTPPPPEAPTLAQRKRALLAELETAGQAAIDKRLSPGRVRLLAMDYADAGMKSKTKRTTAEKKSIEQFEKFNGYVNEIKRKVARAAVAIDDLTETNISDWTVPAF